MKHLLVVAPILALLASPVPARAQGMYMLSPVQGDYRVGGFYLETPRGPGWRQVPGPGNQLTLVYAEEAPDGLINMRVEVVAEAFEIPDPAAVEDIVALARLNYRQRYEERGESVTGRSNIQVVPGSRNVYTFTFLSKVNEEEVVESFFVMLAPDRSEYLSAKFMTRDSDYKQQSYYVPFFNSLLTLAHVGGSEEAADEAPATGQAPAASPAPEDETASAEDDTPEDAGMPEDFAEPSPSKPPKPEKAPKPDKPEKPGANAY